MGAFLLTAFAVTGCANAPPGTPAPIRVPIVLRNGLPTATVEVSGKALSLFLDLGGYNAIALTPQELSRVPVTFLEGTVRSIQASGAIYESRRFVAEEVSLGGTSVGALEGSEFIFSEGAAPPDRNGYIGFGLLSRFLVVIDYPDRSVRLYPSGSSDALTRECGTRAFAVDVVDGVAQSTVDTEQGKLVFSWDTGSSRSVLLPSAIKRSRRSTESGPSAAYRIGKFVLGEREFGLQDFLLIDYRGLTTDGVLGTDFFAPRVVCLDMGTGVGAVRP